MSDLENIVPSLELCNKIPNGYFEYSVFGWKYTQNYVTGISDWKIVLRDGDNVDCPAPTLQEIMEALIKKGCLEPTLKYLSAQGVWEVDYTCFQRFEITEKSPVEAALKVWLNLV